MSTVRLELLQLLHQPLRENARFLFPSEPRRAGKLSRVSYSHRTSSGLPGTSGCLCCRFSPTQVRPIRASVAETPLAEAPNADQADVLFRETFPLKRTKTVEGKVTVRLDKRDDGKGKAWLIVGCNLEGRWVLHWGVTHPDEAGRVMDAAWLDGIDSNERVGIQHQSWKYHLQELFELGETK